MKKLPAVAFLVGILIAITWLNFSTVSHKLNRTPLREYKLMQENQQKLVILESRRVLFHEYLEHRDIDRASCVAHLFAADTKEGARQFSEIEDHIENEIYLDADQMTEKVVNTFIKTYFCPPTNTR